MQKYICLIVFKYVFKIHKMLAIKLQYIMWDVVKLFITIKKYQNAPVMSTIFNIVIS